MSPKIKKFLVELSATIILSLLALCLAMLVGCSSARVASSSVYDSVAVKTIYKTKIIKDTIPYYIPKETIEVQTIDTFSYIENKWAYSEAIVSEGVLTHSLSTKDEPLTIVVDKVVDTIYREVVKEIVKNNVEVVEVEKPDTWFEQMQKKGFWLMMSVIVLLILWRRLKHWITLFK